MSAAPLPSPSEPDARNQAASQRLLRRLVRPGSFERSTSLWWTIPPGLIWLCLAVGAIGARLVTQSLSAEGQVEWILLVDLIASSIWVLVVLESQNETDTETADGRIEPRGRHEYWRARTVAWDMLSVSVVGALLVALLILGPSTVLPSADVPLVELAVLVVTLLLLATFSRYAAMAFNTDAARMVQKLEELSSKETEARNRDTERVTRLFTEQTDRIVAKADAQIEATSTGLATAITQLDRVVRAVEDLTNIERETQSATRALAEAQTSAAEEQRRLAAERRADEQRAARARLEAIQPLLHVRLRTHGLVFGDLAVDVFNDGFDGVGLEGSVIMGNLQYPFRALRLGSKSTQSFDLVDLRQLPHDAQIVVGVALRDVDGNLRRFEAGPFGYTRESGVFNRTKSVSIRPSNWVAAVLVG